MHPVMNWLDRNKDIGILLLRLFIGIRLVYGVVDNVFSWDHMIKFQDFLHHFNFPVPLVSAVISVYAQLFAGLMYMFGWKIRLAAMLMIFNFLIAVIMVHRNDSFEQATPALAMLFCSLFFLFNGSGKYSVDNLQKKS